MGRALFSQQVKAASAPAVRTEPEPKVDVCERWGAWNRFDPDSEDFFQDAEYEAFIDPAQLQRQLPRDLSTMIAGGDIDISDSSDSSDSSSDSEQGSPMAVGPDDPAILMTGSWSVESEEAGSADAEWRAEGNTTETPMYVPGTRASVFTPGQTGVTEDVGIPVFIPPASLRALTPEIEDGRGRDAVLPRSPTLRRTVNITPITVSRIREPSSRSPSPPPRRRATAGEAPVVPSTPPTASYMGQTMLSPSPPPSITPRFYSWQHHPIPAIPSSPTLARGTRDGPLTNPRARMSFARIESSPGPTRVRVSNSFI
ncbi:unnamed protein product [Cyclocybe aegerita]|uniref:Uncharacterized protein n=1 Tax=Cyclocybe aegerita TaxID=1973307 RepID=A0A8S0W3W6_CYCAE|nr:unnamed protein product [Cyclocybe aegerita]